MSSIVKHLHAHGHQADVLTSMALADAPRENIGGVDINRFSHFYPYLALSSQAKLQLDLKAGNLFSFSLLKHLLASPPADIYHLHTGNRMGGIVRFAARYHRRPYVISLHGGISDVPEAERSNWQEPTRGLWEWGRILGAAVGARRVLDDASAVLCINRNEQEILQRQFPQKRIQWTPNTVNVEHFRSGKGNRFKSQHGVPPQAKIILSVARIDRQKNQLATVDVFEKVAHVVPDVWLALIGAPTDSDYAQRLHLKILASPYRERILCLGNVDSASHTLVDAYSAASVFLLSSIHEPFGIVLLEAWAAGVPIVASSVGGIPSFVDHNRNGLLYTSGDLETAARLVVALLSDVRLAECIRTAAKEKVRHFDDACATKTLIGLYEEVQSEYPFRA